MVFIGMENSSKLGAVKGCPGKFCANTFKAVQLNSKVRLIRKKKESEGSCKMICWVVELGSLHYSGKG